LAFLPPDGKKKVSFYVSYSFLSRYCEPDLKQKTCEFKDLYFWRNSRKLNLISNNIDIAVFGPLRLEIWAITHDSL
jgi:hypothetical protein